HLHSLFRILIRSVNIKSNNEGIASYERPAYFGVMHLHILFPPIVFASYLIDSLDLRWHVFHLARLDANDIFRIKIIDRLLPFASFAKLHQSHRNIFRTHISSIVLVYFAIETASSVYSFVQILLIDGMIFVARLFCSRMRLYHSKDVAARIFGIG